MLRFKKIREPGYSVIYALIIGGLCVTLALAIYKIELQRKKYTLDSQKAILESENIQFNSNFCDGRCSNECDLYGKQ